VYIVTIVPLPLVVHRRFRKAAHNKGFLHTSYILLSGEEPGAFVGGAVHLEGSSRVRKGRYKNLLKV
jgi:hypothetical protein